MKTYEKLLETLETLIDGHNLKEVTDALSQVARLKAFQVEENWKAESLRKSWIRDAQKIESIASNLEN